MSLPTHPVPDSPCVPILRSLWLPFFTLNPSSTSAETALPGTDYSQVSCPALSWPLSSPPLESWSSASLATPKSLQRPLLFPPHLNATALGLCSSVSQICTSCPSCSLSPDLGEYSLLYTSYLSRSHLPLIPYHPDGANLPLLQPVLPPRMPSAPPPPMTFPSAPHLTGHQGL